MREPLHWLGCARRKRRDHGKWCAHVVAHRLDRAIHPGHERLPVHDDQFAVEAVDGAEAHIAVGEQFADAEVAVVPAVDERLHRGRLEHAMCHRRVGRRGVVVFHRQVQGVDQFGIDGHTGSLPKVTPARPRMST